MKLIHSVSTTGSEYLIIKKHRIVLAGDFKAQQSFFMSSIQRIHGQKNLIFSLTKAVREG